MKKDGILQTSPHAHYMAHKREVDTAIDMVLRKGRYILGEAAASFEREFARFIGVGHGVGVANGTDAITLSLMACGARPGDGVVTVSHTAVATIAAIERAGCVPCFVDVDPSTYTMDPVSLGSALKDFHRGKKRRVPGKIRAVIPVHLYGHPCDMKAIRSIAGRYDLFVVEDCAQAHGASISGKKAGSWGDIAAFSFYPTKNLGCVGDGGGVVTDSAVLAGRVRMLREYGWRKRYISESSGMNSRLDEIQAAILSVYLKYLARDNERRCQIADIYGSLLKDVVDTPTVRPGYRHVYHQYVIQIEGRDRVRGLLQKEGIATLIHYPLPVHIQPAYRKKSIIISRDLKVTESIYKRILSLPMYPELSDRSVLKAGTLLSSILSSNKRR